MPRFARAVAALTLITSATAVRAQQGATPPIRIAASSFASAEVHVNSRPIGGRWYEEDAGLSGPARIAISYGQPHARGRQIVGGLIPTDSVWRFGANMATTLHTDVDMTLGSLAIPRGDYTLFLLHSKTAWQLIVSSRTAEWGTDYDAAKDLGRIPLAAKTLTDNEESLTMYLVPDSQNPASGYATLGGTYRIRWGTFDLSAKWAVRQ